MTRNEEEDHGQDDEDTKRMEQEEELPKSYNYRTSDDLWTTDGLRTSDA